MSVFRGDSRPVCAQQGFLTGAQLPYLLLAIALIAIIFLWAALNGKTAELAALEDAKAKEIEKLAQQLDNTEGNLAGLNAQHTLLQQKATSLLEETIPTLKREASFARADNQRAQHIFAARENLITQLQNSKLMNADLMEKANQLPRLKKELSTVNAANMRLKHISNARDNLMVQLKRVQQSNAQTKDDSLVAGIETSKQNNEQTTGESEYLSKLKKQLSTANAANMRLKHISKARNNLITDIQNLKQTNKSLQEQSEQLPQLKRQLSLANAANMRLEHVSKARDNLMAQAQELVHKHKGQINAVESARDIEIATLIETIKNKTVEISQLENNFKDLSREASFAKAQVQRNRHLTSARNNLMGRLNDVRKENEDLSAQVLEMHRLKHMLSAANAENMRLRHISEARDRLMSQLNAAK